MVDLRSRVVKSVLQKRELTPRTVHSLWININGCDLHVVIGMRYSPPLKRHFCIKEYGHISPYGQTWPR